MLTSRHIVGMKQSEPVRSDEEKSISGLHDVDRQAADRISARLPASAAQRTHHSLRLQAGKTTLTTTTRLRFERRSTPIRLQFDRATTVLRYGIPVLGCCTKA